MEQWFPSVEWTVIRNKFKLDSVLTYYIDSTTVSAKVCYSDFDFADVLLLMVNMFG